MTLPGESGAATTKPESTTYIYVALVADLVVATAKLIVGLVAMSTAMLAEAAHSFADTTNQIFLLIGVRLSDRPADEERPYGHGKERVFWAFLAAIFIFVSGSFFSLYEGIRGILDPTAHSGPLWPSYVVLFLSFLFAVWSLVAAWREVRHQLREQDVTLSQFIRDVPAVTLKTSFYSDIAAVVGVLIAAIGLALSEATGNTRFDGMASVVIGVILVVVALILGLESRDVLLGSAAAPRSRRAIRGAIESFPEVDAIVEVLTMQLGLNSVLVTGQIDIIDGLTTDDIERLLPEIAQRVREAAPEVRNIYLEPHPVTRSGAPDVVPVALDRAPQ